MLIGILTLSSIITRHDVEDQRYIDYAARSEFQSFCFFRDGGCAVVAENWVLTAAHVARDLALNDSVFLDEQFALVRDIQFYPETTGMRTDLALVQIDRPFTSVTPARIFDGRPHRDMPIHLVGRGDRGTGLTGPEAWDKILRGATNIIDEVTGRHVIFQFDGPDSERTTDLEGISGPGDSGGPAYFLDEEGVYLVGISSAQDSRGMGRPGVYGVAEYYVNVASYKDWIDGVVTGNRQVRNPDLAAPEAAAGERVPLFIDFIFQLAHEAGLTEEVKPIRFSISETELVIEDQVQERRLLEKALARYRDLFGKPLEGGGFNFKPD